MPDSKPISILRQIVVLIFIVGAANSIIPVSAGAQQLPQPLVLADWQAFKERFVSPRGRVVDTGNEFISHSEGQGYAMLFAVAYNDRKTFDLIMEWADEFLGRKDDNLYSWRWRPTPYGGFVDDPNNASDGDILIAWALLRAGDKWGHKPYQEKAQKIIRDVERTALLQNEGSILLIPGERGFVHSDRIVINLSYYVFPAINDFANRDTRRNSPWRKIITDGLSLLERSQFGDYGLPPDWLDYSYGVAPSQDWDPVFGYDAIRIPLYLAWWNPRATQLQTFNRYFNSSAFARSPKDKALLGSSDRRIEVSNAPDGMKAVALVTNRLSSGRPISPREFPAINRQTDYYSACLILLSKLAVADNERSSRPSASPR